MPSVRRRRATGRGLRLAGRGINEDVAKRVAEIQAQRRRSDKAHRVRRFLRRADLFLKKHKPLSKLAALSEKYGPELAGLAAQQGYGLSLAGRGFTLAGANRSSSRIPLKGYKVIKLQGMKSGRGRRRKK